jgi:diacylglycerol kinase (ATP)
MTKTRCIINPRSAGGRTGKRWGLLAQSLTEAGLEFEAVFTRSPGDGTRLAHEALSEGAERIIAVGGDGSLHDVVNGFFYGDKPLNPRACLGILPSGSGSDFIKSLGIPQDPAGALAILKRGKPKAIDLGRVNFINFRGERETRYYLNSASAGLSGAAVARLKALPDFLSNPLGYAVACLYAHIPYRAVPVLVNVDGHPRPAEKVLMVVVSNGRYFGGGMHISPTAKLDDGLLDVLVVREQPLKELLLKFPQLYFGTHLQLPFITLMRGGSITIEGDSLLLEVDGEQPGTTPAKFEVVPKALTVLL